MRKVIRPKQLVSILEKHGFVFIRQTGSHAHYRHTDGRWTTVPMHNVELKRSTWHSILKETGLTLEDL